MTKAVNIAQYGNVSPSWRNRIINGAMVIDQRNAGASVTNISGNGYTLDRWFTSTSQASKFTIQQNAGSVTPPTGFKNYLGITSSSAYSVLSTDFFALVQAIEGLNVADLGWGASGAQSVTLSFWIRSSLTGTFSGVISNGAFDYQYPFTYTISSANTWEQKTITLTGPTAGTWLTTNGVGIYVYLNIGAGSSVVAASGGAWGAQTVRGVTGSQSVVGTNGATWYITGVQLEVGTSATNFEYRDYGRELIMCQRYYQTSAAYYAFANNSTIVTISTVFPVAMRTGPTMSIYSSVLRLSDNSADYTSSGAFSSVSAYSSGVRFSQAGYSGLTAGKFYIGYGDLLAANAEL